MSEATPFLRVRDLCVTYRGLLETVPAVHDFSAEVFPGEAVGLVGESGSGKTTVAMAVMGLLPAGRTRVIGSVQVEGYELLGASGSVWRRFRGRRVGMIFQDPMTSLNPYLTVGFQVAEPLLAHGGLPRRAARERAVGLLEQMAVENAGMAFRRHPHQYSGGMRQRAMIASCLGPEPGLLIADEPTTALDVITQARILRMLRRNLADRNMALLLITHDLGIVAGVCDRVIVMRDGAIVETGDVRQVYHRPASDYTKRLLAAVPRLDSERQVRTPQGAGMAEGPAGRPPAIELRDVTVRFGRPRGLWRRRRQPTGRPAVDGVSLSVPRGEILGLVGESGSGKTTLARVVAGLVTPASGELSVGGHRVDVTDRKALRTLRRRVQMVFQDPQSSLNGRFTAEKIIAEPLINFGLRDRKAARERARALMELVQLDPRWGNRYPHEFSGGQCQRIGIARALAVEPDILLCDEPVSALDVSIQAEVLDLLAGLRDRLGLTMLFISHDLSVVRHVSHRVAVMNQGRIVEIQEADRICSDAAHPYTKSLLAAVPVPDPEVYRL